MENQQFSVSQPSIPIAVKVIAVLYYIGAVLMMGFGSLSLFGIVIMGQFPGTSILGSFLGGGLFLVLGIISIALGFLGIFIGGGLWKGKNRARILAIIFACLGIILALVSLVKGNGSILVLVLYALIAGYLLFSQKVKAAFSPK